jgi:hypothetical protein
MRKLLKILVVACALLCGAKAHAGPYGDDLSKCLVKATSSDDQIVFTQWMFAAMSLHPAVSGLVSITDEQRSSQQEGGSTDLATCNQGLPPTSD